LMDACVCMYFMIVTGAVLLRVFAASACIFMRATADVRSNVVDLYNSAMSATGVWSGSSSLPAGIIAFIVTFIIVDCVNACAFFRFKHFQHGTAKILWMLAALVLGPLVWLVWHATHTQSSWFLNHMNWVAFSSWLNMNWVAFSSCLKMKWAAFLLMWRAMLMRLNRTHPAPLYAPPPPPPAHAPPPIFYPPELAPRYPAAAVDDFQWPEEPKI
jgi:hypothetical protein